MKKLKNKGGRPPKLTLSRIEAIAKLIAAGMPEEFACIHEGVNYETFRSAKDKPKFSPVIKREQAVFIHAALQTIRNGGDIEVVGTTENGSPITRTKPWQGAAWILERRHKPLFNRTDTHALTDTEGHAIFTPADLKELEGFGRELVQTMEKLTTKTKEQKQ